MLMKPYLNAINDEILEKKEFYIFDNWINHCIHFYDENLYTLFKDKYKTTIEPKPSLDIQEN